MTATIPTQRVQHYGSDGLFRTGWFVDGKGGDFAIGLTSDGRIAICTARGREIFLFDLDGRPLGHQACSAPGVGLFRGNHIMQPADFPAGEIRLQRVVPAERPSASLVAILLVPFWHPLVAWSIAMVGGFLGWLFGCIPRKN